MHVFHCWLFLVYLEMGIEGLGIAVTLTQVVVFVGMLILTNMQEDLKEALIPFDKRAFQDLSPYFNIAFPGYVMLALEWWVWELMILISGLLGVEEQAVQVILMTLVAYFFHFSNGFSFAASALIGQQIGKGDLEKAKLFYGSFRIITGISLMITSSLLYFFRRQILSSFSSDKQIVELSLKISLVLTLTTFPDGFKAMQ